MKVERFPKIRFPKIRVPKIRFPNNKIRFPGKIKLRKRKEEALVSVVQLTCRKAKTFTSQNGLCNSENGTEGSSTS